MTSNEQSLQRSFNSRAEIAPDPVPLDDEEHERATEAARDRRQSHVMIALFAGYLLFAAALTYIRGGIFLTPDRIAILLLAAAALFGQGKSFVRDWVPFVLLLFGYELMRGVADNMANHGTMTGESHGAIQLDWLIRGDTALFLGHEPSLWLQDHLYQPGRVHWYDTLSAVVYLLHFVFPLVFAFILWPRTRDAFRRFTISLLAMSYGAFVFYMLIPTAPPWLAQDWGYLDGLERPSHQAFRLFLPTRLATFDTFKVWTVASPNRVAALPSLHAAYPWLVLLFAVRFFGKRGWLFLIYNAAVWFSVVYLSQHWVVDVIAGILWVTVVFFAAEAARSKLQVSRRRDGGMSLSRRWERG